jgi:hypothetical protein
MTLPLFRQALAGLGSLTPDDAQLRDLFVEAIDAWMRDASTPDRLVDRLNRLLGNVWFSSNQIHQHVFDAVAKLAETVRELDGMTMNERLFSFGLLDLWDRSTDEARNTIRVKLKAH